MSLPYLHRRNNGFYYARWNEKLNGRWIKRQKALKTQNLTMAKKKLSRFVADFTGETTELLIYDVIETFQKSLDTQNLDKKTTYKYIQQLQVFVGFMKNRVINIGQIRQDHILDFQKWLQDGKRLTPSTISGYKRTLRKMFLDFEARDYRVKNPMKRLRIGAMAKRTRFFSQEEIRKIISATTTDYERALILFILQTGFRIEEVVNSRWENINMVRQTISIVGKFKKKRIQRIPKLAFEAIQKISGKETIFGKRQKQLYRDIKSILSKAKVDGYPHAFRDTYASYSLAIGLNPVIIRDRLGHASLVQLDKYAHAINETVEEDIRGMFNDWQIV